MRTSLFILSLSAAWLAGGVAGAQCTSAGDVCDDGEWCTVDDRCNASLDCVGTPRDCLDGVFCTDDVCNEASDTCDHPPDPMGTPCSDGSFCTEGDVCDGSGLCMSGPRRDCGDGLSCTADMCNEGDDVCDNPIRPGACLIGGDCRYDGEPNPASPCEICDPDVLNDGWSPGPAGVTCGDSSCAAGIRTDRVCDDMGACAETTEPCEFGMCIDDQFCATCAVDDDCPESTYCRAPECVLAAPGGSICDRDRRCLSENCTNGLCCDRTCDGPCESCIAGVCTPYAAGTDPDDACGDSTCDGFGYCVGDDAGSRGDGGGVGNVVGHGSGCIACRVGGGPAEAPVAPLVLFLTGFVGIVGRRRSR